MRILFLHGWRSVPGGVKPSYLRQHGHEVLNPALPDGDFGEAVRIAQAAVDRHRPDVIVGSSRGGAVAMSLQAGATPLVLLCPAWRNHGTATRVGPNTIVLHARADDVVPFADSEELVRNSRLPPSALVEVGADHRLADPEPLRAMLEACARLRPKRIRERNRSDGPEDSFLTRPAKIHPAIALAVGLACVAGGCLLRDGIGGALVGGGIGACILAAWDSFRLRFLAKRPHDSH